MKLLRMFSIGSGRILTKGHSVPGIVTGVDRSYLYIVKKPARLYVHESNTMFSHWLFFTYCVNGISYKGRLWVSLRSRCPQPGETIQVFYDPGKPQNYACNSFGPNVNPIGW